MFRISVLFIIMIFSLLYVSVGIYSHMESTCMTASLRGMFGPIKPNSTSATFLSACGKQGNFEVRRHVFVYLRYRILPLSKILLLNFGNGATVLYCFVCLFYYWFLELVRQCCIVLFFYFTIELWNCCDSVLFFVFRFIIVYI